MSQPGPSRPRRSTSQDHEDGEVPEFRPANGLPMKPSFASITSAAGTSKPATKAQRTISPNKAAVTDSWKNPLGGDTPEPPRLGGQRARTGPAVVSPRKRPRSPSRDRERDFDREYSPPPRPARWADDGRRNGGRGPEPSRPYEQSSQRNRGESFRDGRYDDDYRRHDYRHDERDYRDDRDGRHRPDRNHGGWDGPGRSDWDKRRDYDRYDGGHHGSYRPEESYRPDRHSRYDEPEPQRYAHSPKKRSLSPAKDDHWSPNRRPDTPPMEEGEIDDEIRPRTPSTSPPPPPPDPAGDTPSSGTSFKPKALHMKHRPPPPPMNPYRANTPPPPTDSVPPPPSDSPMPNSQDRSPPRNKHHDHMKAMAKYDDGVVGSVPHAPNRNLINPSTRASTPVPKGSPVPYIDAIPKKYMRMSVKEEEDVYKRTFRGCSTLNAYDVGKKLGEGTFGVVTKGVELISKRPIALKKLLTHNPRDGVSVTTVREIKILKALDHPNVVPLLDMVVQPKSNVDRSGRQEIFMVFPFMDHDLCGLLANREYKTRVSVNKLMMRQILEGMAYIHSQNIIHRDIKTANILVDKHGGIMIADFGLARNWTGDGANMPRHLANEYTNMVVTRWYRSPELLLGETRYGPAVDMWSIGCVLGEMYHRDPILPGGPNDDDQLRRIIAHLGLLSETFPGWKQLPGYQGMETYPWDTEPTGKPLHEVAQKWGMDVGAINLMLKLLHLDPAKRLTAEEALDHPWFHLKPKPADPRKTDLGVESSHEMTKKKDIIADPLPQPRQPPPQYAAGHQNFPPPGRAATGQHWQGPPAGPRGGAFPPANGNPYQGGPRNGGPMGAMNGHGMNGINGMSGNMGGMGGMNGMNGMGGLGGMNGRTNGGPLPLAMGMNNHHAPPQLPGPGQFPLPQRALSSRAPPAPFPLRGNLPAPPFPLAGTNAPPTGPRNNGAMGGMGGMDAKRGRPNYDPHAGPEAKRPRPDTQGGLPY